MRIGFMGRDDRAPRGLGAGLIVDAARRVYRNPDITAWGLILDAEGGSGNPSLVRWYESVGFTSAKTLPGVMYGPLKRFPPELHYGLTNRDRPSWTPAEGNRAPENQRSQATLLPSGRWMQQVRSHCDETQAERRSLGDEFTLPSQLRARGPGERIWPPSVPGFVIAVGTMLASYSNDRVRTTLHRVINRNDASHTRSQSSSAS